MDRMLKTKYSKREGKYTIDYSKVRERNPARFDFLRQVNQKFELLLMINTGIDMYQVTGKKRQGFILTDDADFEKAYSLLKDSGLEFSLKKGQRRVDRTIMGFSTGRHEMQPVSILAVILRKNQLKQDFFEKLCRSHDLMIGIGSVEDPALLEGFEAGKFESIDDVGAFSFTLVDSQWLGYFYTDLDPAILA